MRKPRDIDAELKVLGDKQKQLRSKRTAQLGALVTATGADSLDPDILAGVLLEAVERAKDADTQEAWRRKGDSFFRRERRRGADRANSQGQGDSAPDPAGELDDAAPIDGTAAAG